MNVGTRLETTCSQAYQDLFRLKVIERPWNPPLKRTWRAFNPTCGSNIQETGKPVHRRVHRLLVAG